MFRDIAKLIAVYLSLMIVLIAVAALAGKMWLLPVILASSVTLSAWFGLKLKDVLVQRIDRLRRF